MPYKLIQLDYKGTRWVFEGYCGGEPIFVQEHEARPKLLNEAEVNCTAGSIQTSDEIIVEKT
jgi:hypothetical protein